MSLFPLILIACSSTPKVLIETKYVRVLPPLSLIQDVPEPKWEGRTNQDLVKYIIEQELVIKQCNSDKQLLREFLNE